MRLAQLTHEAGPYPIQGLLKIWQEADEFFLLSSGSSGVQIAYRTQSRSRQGTLVLANEKHDRPYGFRLPIRCDWEAYVPNKP